MDERTAARDPVSGVCVWCGYDTAVEGATRCAECGANFEDRARIQPVADQAIILLGFGIVALIVTSLGLLGAVMSDRIGLTVYAVSLGIVTIGAIRAARAFRRLKEGHRKHRCRVHAIIAMVLLFPQAMVLWAIALLNVVSRFHPG